MTEALGWTLVSGSWREGAAVPVSDRGFRYGMSVFETIARRDGRWLFLDDHLRRLQRACTAAGFVYPLELNERTFAEGLPASDGLARVYISAGERTGTERTYLFQESILFPTAPDFARGYRLTLSRAPIPCPLGGWKTGNYWAHIQALAEARENKGDEAVVCNAQGAVVSAAMANLFVVLDGVLHTPALGLGARDGVIRAWVQAQMHAEESLLSIEDVMRAEECFITNSRLGVMPVAEIDGCALPGRALGEDLSLRYCEEILRG